MRPTKNKEHQNYDKWNKTKPQLKQGDHNEMREIKITMHHSKIFFLVYLMSGSGKRAEKKKITNFDLSTYSRSTEQADYHAF